VAQEPFSVALPPQYPVEHGYALDTVETALPWSKVESTALAIQAAIREAVQGFNERVLVFAHLSHVYADGASIYTTYLWRRSPEPDQTWHTAGDEAAASQVMIASGGTITTSTVSGSITSRIWRRRKGHRIADDRSSAQAARSRSAVKSGKLVE